MTVENIIDLLEKDSSGKTKPTLQNGLIILRNDPLLAGKIKYNILRGGRDIVGDVPWQRDEPAMDDNDLSYIRHRLEDAFGYRSKETLVDLLNIIGNENQYHPVREKLESIVWDGNERIDCCLHHFFGCDETKLIKALFRTFLFGAIARVYKPGVKFDTMIVYAGGQGKGKSTFFRYLALNDDWFSDDLSVIGDKKIYEKLSGHWIVEMSEMNATQSAKSVEEIKAFLSRQKDNYRKPYAREPKDWKRGCVFAGTANKIAFLPLDRTGNRRIWPVRVYHDRIEKDIMEDEEYSRHYIEQMWGEAMHIWKTEKPNIYLTREMESEFKLYQLQFMREDSDRGIVLNYLATTEEKTVCTRMIYEKGFGFSDRPTKTQLLDIGEIVDGAIVDGVLDGWEKLTEEVRMGIYGPQRGWKRTKPIESEPITVIDGPFGTGELLDL